MLAPNPESSELINLNFQPLEVVSRYRDPQLQFTKKIESAVLCRYDNHRYETCIF